MPTTIEPRFSLNHSQNDRESLLFSTCPEFIVMMAAL